MASGQPPDDVLDAIKMVQKLRKKKILSREEKIDMNRAKLRVAYWACRNDNVTASRENLSYVLGEDAHDIMKAYDKYLESPGRDDKNHGGKKRRDGDKTGFWGDV